jgi:hypothetical protein
VELRFHVLCIGEPQLLEHKVCMSPRNLAELILIKQSLTLLKATSARNTKSFADHEYNAVSKYPQVSFGDRRQHGLMAAFRTFFTQCDARTSTPSAKIGRERFTVCRAMLNAQTGGGFRLRSEATQSSARRYVGYVRPTFTESTTHDDERAGGPTGLARDGTQRQSPKFVAATCEEKPASEKPRLCCERLLDFVA